MTVTITFLLSTCTQILAVLEINSKSEQKLQASKKGKT